MLLAFAKHVSSQVAAASLRPDIFKRARVTPSRAAVYVMMAVMVGSCMLRTVPDSTMYGLLYNYNVIALVAVWSPLVIAGACPCLGRVRCVSV